MNEPRSVADDPVEALPMPVTPEPSESAAANPKGENETSLTAISISQSIRQVQLFVPSMIQVIGDVADRHPDIAHKIVDDIIDKGQHRQEIERVVVRGNDRRTDRSSYGIAVIATAVAPLVGVNLIGRYVAQRERRQKMTLPAVQDADVPPESGDSD